VHTLCTRQKNLHKSGVKYVHYTLCTTHFTLYTIRYLLLCTTMHYTLYPSSLPPPAIAIFGATI
jgi:hypothetical protein